MGNNWSVGKPSDMLHWPHNLMNLGGWELRKVEVGLSHRKLSKYGIMYPQIEVVILNIDLLSLCNISYETIDKSLVLAFVKMWHHAPTLSTSLLVRWSSHWMTCFHCYISPQWDKFVHIWHCISHQRQHCWLSSFGWSLVMPQ